MKEFKRVTVKSHRGVPVTILKMDQAMQLWDALYVTQAGEVYAAVGDVLDNLHILIANQLVEQGVVTGYKQEKHFCYDHYLNTLGFAKVARGHVMYDGYEYGLPMTKEQQKVISNYGKLYNLKSGKCLLIGYEKHFMTGAMFGMINKYELKTRLKLPF